MLLKVWTLGQRAAAAVLQVLLEEQNLRPHSRPVESEQLHRLACQASLSMEFSRQEYWSGLSFPSPGDLRNLGIEPRSLALQAASLPTKECWSVV